MPPRQTKRWKLREPISEACSQELSEYPPFFRQVLYARGVNSLVAAYHYLDAQVDDDRPELLKGMRECVDRLVFAIKHGELMIVYDGGIVTAAMQGDPAVARAFSDIYRGV